MQTPLMKTSLREYLSQWWLELSVFPWHQMLGVLRERFRDARLGTSASSLTFTTLLALVPLFALGLAVFAAFPMFGKFQDTIQRWLIDSLVPESIARQVMGYMTQFSRKASRLGAVGFVAVMFTAVSLMVTIERTLGQIWRVEQQRPLAQRVLLYWSAISLGPLLLGASLAISSFVVSASGDVVNALPGALRWVLDCFEFALLVACVSGLYFYVPYTRVRWRHAITAALLVALSLELAKKLLAIYLVQIPTYSVIYGAFAVVPILLVWIYVAWVIVLLGSVLAASLPELGRQTWRQSDGAGWAFRLALEALAALQSARAKGDTGLNLPTLSQQLQIEPRELAAVLGHLQQLDWVGLLREEGGAPTARYVLLADLEMTWLAPLAQRLLVQTPASSDPLRLALRLDQVSVAQVLRH